MFEKVKKNLSHLKENSEQQLAGLTKKTKTFMKKNKIKQNLSHLKENSEQQLAKLTKKTKTFMKKKSNATASKAKPESKAAASKAAAAKPGTAKAATAKPVAEVLETPEVVKSVPPPGRKKLFFGLILCLVLALIGMADATTLLYNDIFQGGACEQLGFLGSSCEDVTNSVYGQIYNVPISLLGLLAYTFLFICFLFALWQPALIFYATIVTLVGFVASGYLMYLQGFVLQKWCLLCLISAANFTLLFLFSSALFITHYKRGRQLPDMPMWRLFFPRITMHKTLFVVLIFSSFLLLLAFEMVRARQLLQKQSGLSTEDVGCALMASKKIAATMNGEIITMDELDRTINLKASEACLQITALRRTALNHKLLSMLASEKDTTLSELLTSLGMEEKLANLVETPSQLKAALQLSSHESNSATEQALARIRQEKNVEVNIKTFVSPNLEDVQLQQMQKILNF